VVGSFKDIDLNSKVTLYEALKRKAFKVIGEVSPDATWVTTEGMEFEEDEWRFAWWNKFAKRITTPYSNGDEYTNYGEGAYIKMIQIKGPCGHFH
jgi:hypothetical protein